MWSDCELEKTMASDYEKISSGAIQNIRHISQHTGVELNPETFCILPFTHISTMTHGEIKLCCRGQAPRGGANPHVQDPDFDLEAYWQGDYMNSVRDDLIAGRKIAQCKNCWKMESQEILSLRHNRLIDHGTDPAYVQAVKDYVDTGTVPFRVPLIELKLSNICNYKCRMCWPKDSSAWAADWDKVQQFYDASTQEYMQNISDITGGKRMMNMYETNEAFVTSLVTLMETVEEIEFAGGEPILDPIHFRILSNVTHPERVILKYSTNLSTLLLNDKFNILELWKRFKGVRLTISIDGHRDLNGYIRRGSDWDTLKQNIQAVKHALGDSIIQIKGSTCISALNAQELGRTAQAIMFELGLQWHTSRLQYPDFMHANILSAQQLQAGIQDLELVHQQLVDQQAGNRNNFNLLHVKNAQNWLEYCINNSNTDPGVHQRFLDFNSALDD